MNYLNAVALLCMSFAANALAGGLDYTLDVKGMMCAYCAYNVSKQLKSLDGVVSDSVSVDLENGMVTLRSEKGLETATLSELLQTAGFTLGTVNATASETAPVHQESNGSVVMSLTINADRLVDGQFDAMLEALGAVATQRSGRITIAGPDDLEVAVLKPVLAGRKVVIDVEYERGESPDNTVRINLIAE